MSAFKDMDWFVGHMLILEDGQKLSIIRAGDALVVLTPSPGDSFMMRHSALNEDYHNHKFTGDG